MVSFMVQYISDFMLNHLDKIFQELQYDCFKNITCAPGSEITKVLELSRHCTQNCDLLVLNTGINNIFSVGNCLYLYEQVHKELSQLHPITKFAFTSVSYIADDKFSGNDRSWEVNSGERTEQILENVLFKPWQCTLHWPDATLWYRQCDWTRQPISRWLTLFTERNKTCC